MENIGETSVLFFREVEGRRGVGPEKGTDGFPISRGSKSLRGKKKHPLASPLWVLVLVIDFATIQLKVCVTPWGQTVNKRVIRMHISSQEGEAKIKASSTIFYYYYFLQTVK